MCWSSANKPIKKVAKEDITVYKIVMPSNDVGCLSRFKNYLYLYGDKNKDIELTYIPSTQFLTVFYDIYEGYHSYATKEMAREIYSTFMCNDGIIVECTIPKGSCYYENDDEEIVSSNIIINKPIYF